MTHSPIPRWKWLLAAFIFGGLVLAVWLAKPPLEIYETQPLPELNLTTLEGEPVSSAGWKGPLILNFFASWCGPCRDELPELAALAEHLPVYGVAWQDDPEKLRAWLEENKPPFAEVALDNGTEALAKLRLPGLPTTLVLDAEHRIVYRVEGALEPGRRKETLRAIFDIK